MQQLQERHEKLLKAMKGRAVQADEIHMHSYPETHRFVTASDVRIAVDDFATILKEIKGTLGKQR